MAARPLEPVASIASLRQTTWISPVQWGGELDDGRALHTRYRWGELSVRIAGPGASPEQVYETAPRFDELVGDWRDPSIELEDVLRLTGLRLSAECVV